MKKCIVLLRVSEQCHLQSNLRAHEPQKVELSGEGQQFDTCNNSIHDGNVAKSGSNYAIPMITKQRYLFGVPRLWALGSLTLESFA